MKVVRDLRSVRPRYLSWRTLGTSLVFSTAIAAAACGADFVITKLMPVYADTPLATLLTGEALGFPLLFYFIRQRARMRQSQAALEEAQAAKDLANARLEAAVQEAEAANHAKSTFLATMSHEIRTPLNGVLGMAQAIEADVLTPRQRERIELVRESGLALLTILNDILDLSKIESGRLELEETDLEVSTICESVVAGFAGLAAEKGLALKLDVSAAFGVYRGDPVRLRQILSNLVSNAIKFTIQGSVKVSAQYENAIMTLTVEDTGIGVEAALLPSLFTRYQQADSSTTRRFGGTGLGLAICRQLAQAMGGDVSVTSQVGRGSTFAAAVPLDYVGQVELGSDRGIPLPVDPHNGELRVLAAEDNLVNQIVLRTLLSQIGIEPEIVSNGRLALEAWASATFDVVLMDVHMPEMDGLAATREIRRIEADRGLMRTPIIALTAEAMPRQVKEFFAAGMDSFVAKPIDAARLFEALSSLPTGMVQEGGPERAVN